MTTIPKYVPIWSSPSSTYSDPGADHHGDPTRVEPSAGEQSIGAIPDDPIDAQTWNWNVGTIGEHLAAIVDLHAFTWTPQPAYVNAELDENDNTEIDPPLIYAAGDSWLVKSPDGATGICFHARKHGQGLSMSAAGDTSLFTAAVNSGASATAIILTDRTLDTIVAINPSGGTARQSSDRGATWAAAGSVTGTGSSTVGGYFDGAWHAAKTDVDGSHEVHSDADLSGNWTLTDVDPSNNVDATQFLRFVKSPDVAIFLPAQCGTTTDILINAGAGWSAETVGAPAPSLGWRGDYNAHLDLFMFTNRAGECYISAGDDGLTWTLAFEAGAMIWDVAASGRGWQISVGSEDFSGPATTPEVWFLAYDSAQVLTAYPMAWESPASDYARYHLLRFRGRVIAARMNDTGARLEWWESSVNPADLDLNGR